MQVQLGLWQDAKLGNRDHPGMIRARSTLAAGAMLIGLAVIFGQRPAAAYLAAPQDRIATFAAYRDRAAAASRALEQLAAALDPARDAGRRGSARIVAGDEPPGPSLMAAAAALDAAAVEADALASRLARVRGSVAAAGRGPDAPASGDELRSIAVQLRDSAGAGDEFSAMRHRTEEVGDTLDAALTALAADDTAAAAEELVAARQQHDILSAWDPGLVTLPIWLGTTGRLIDAIDDLIAAIDAGDAAAAAAAGAAVAAIGDDAREADVALSLAMSEGGGAIAQAPLQRLADVLRAIDAARTELMAIAERGTPLAE
jgi:hypothetical protein